MYAQKIHSFELYLKDNCTMLFCVYYVGGNQNMYINSKSTFFFNIEFFSDKFPQQDSTAVSTKVRDTLHCTLYNMTTTSPRAKHNI